MHSYYKGAEIKNALQIVPFLVVQDVYMTETAKLADIILPTTTSVEKEGSFTNMTRHVQKVIPATPPQYQSRTDHDIFVQLAEVFGNKLKNSSVSVKCNMRYQKWSQFTREHFLEQNPDNGVLKDLSIPLVSRFQVRHK